MPTAEPRHYRCADADFPLPALPWGDEATSLEPAGLTASGRAQPRPDLAPPPASETMTAAAAPRGAHCSSHPSRERHSLSAAASGEALAALAATARKRAGVVGSSFTLQHRLHKPRRLDRRTRRQELWPSPAK
jgi:hypothetical protein